jgi:hypothetical protein
LGAKGGIGGGEQEGGNNGGGGYEILGYNTMGGTTILETGRRRSM